MRLKDKLADRSNASSEVEYNNAYAVMIGEEGKGVKTIIEMVQSTRLDCALGSAGMMRRALMESLHYTVTYSAVCMSGNMGYQCVGALFDWCTL